MIEKSEFYSDKNVVYFEDNPVWSKTLYLWLNHMGFKSIVNFDERKPMEDYVKENHENIDLCVVDFYDIHGNSGSLIKQLRSFSKDLLIVAVSANFITDEKLLDTKEMLKALEAGANRVTFKDIKHLKQIINEHLRLRSLEIFEEIKANPNKYFSV